MPIVQISGPESHWLAAPFPPDILAEWQKPGYDPKLLVYPPGHVGDISPEDWHTGSSFLLDVDPTGEQAEVVVVDEMPSQTPAAHIAKEISNASRDQRCIIGSAAIAGSEATRTFVVTGVSDGELVIGGVVFYVEDDVLASLGRHFRGRRLLAPDKRQGSRS